MLIVIIAMIVLILIVSGQELLRIDQNISDSTWVEKREDIANETRKLGAGYRHILRDESAASSATAAAGSLPTGCPWSGGARREEEA